MLVATLALALAAAAPADGLPRGAGRPMTDRCHMGECGWFAEVERHVIRETPRGRLLHLRLIGGRSAVGEGEDYEEAWGRNARVEWDGAPHDVWVFCSAELPAVMVRTESGLQTDLIDLVNGVPPVLESSRRVYVYACHGPEGDDIPDLAERFGYRATGEEELQLARPEDIFGRLR